MENERATFTNYFDKIWVKVSIWVTILSALMLLISLMGLSYDIDNLGMICFFSLIIEFAYGVILCVNILKDRKNYQHLIPFVYLNWFIGCFCANVFFNVFENFPIWVYVMTFLFCLSNFFIYNKSTHKHITTISYFINGMSFLLIVYFMLYLIPFLPISVIGIIALGIGFYGLVPLIVFVSHLAALMKISYANRKSLIPFSAGIFVVVVSLLLFVFKLNHESNYLNRYTVTKSFENSSDLPSYIVLSQNLKPNFFNEILLKKNIVYTATDDLFEMRGIDGAFGQKQYNERRTHNPFINTAYLFTDELNLSQDDRINILKSNFDKRLEAEEQLWSGKDLITKNIKEDVKIYPAERLAYTEITMDIACDQHNSWGQKEAIYSFQLPEGSVATSLSLWVEGFERKGVLTTKEKAQNAYRQIVSVESRDPSIMQWKEGNKVVVRVFPVSAESPRTFKCGFTTPLQLIKDKLKYTSLNIKGPNISKAETISRIQVIDDKKFTSNKTFRMDNGFYINESTGLDAWEATLPIEGDTFSKAFAWKGLAYKINPLSKEIVPFEPSEIVLDLNSSWTPKEVKAFIAQKDKKFWVYYNRNKRQINSSNYEAVLQQFSGLHYSLLPLYELNENSMVVTKCGTFSANFEELETSDYLKKIRSLTKQKDIKVINIANDINPFWQTVKEQKYVEYIHCDIEHAIELIKNDTYEVQRVPENSVIVAPANIAITEVSKSDVSATSGTNHLYRMYAFGKLLEEQVRIQQDTKANNQFVNLAKEANIVTPISSLIVLEKDEDYTNNGIEKNVNTLGNATVDETAATPLNLQWILVIAALILAFVCNLKPRINRNKIQL